MFTYNPSHIKDNLYISLFFITHVTLIKFYNIIFSILVLYVLNFFIYSIYFGRDVYKLYL
jgi:hypothetical protein